MGRILALRKGRRRRRQRLPTQWVISSGRPETALRGLSFRHARRWGPGVYRAPSLLTTRLVVVSELPATPDTLLLRLIGGAGSTLAEARAELLALPEDAPERCMVLPTLLRLWPQLSPGRRSSEEEEFRMAMQDVVETWKQQLWREGEERGFAKGEERGLLASLREVYEARFGLPAPEIAAAITSMHDPAVLRGWLRLVATAPAGEVDAVLRSSRGR